MRASEASGFEYDMMANLICLFDYWIYESFTPKDLTGEKNSPGGGGSTFF